MHAYNMYIKNDELFQGLGYCHEANRSMNWLVLISCLENFNNFSHRNFNISLFLIICREHHIRIVFGLLKSLCTNNNNCLTKYSMLTLLIVQIYDLFESINTEHFHTSTNIYQWCIGWRHCKRENENASQFDLLFNFTCIFHHDFESRCSWCFVLYIMDWIQ